MLESYKNQLCWEQLGYSGKSEKCKVKAATWLLATSCNPPKRNISALRNACVKAVKRIVMIVIIIRIIESSREPGGSKKGLLVNYRVSGRRKNVWPICWEIKDDADQTKSWNWAIKLQILRFAQLHLFSLLRSKL